MNPFVHAWTAPHYLQTPVDELFRALTFLLGIVAAFAICAITAFFPSKGKRKCPNPPAPRKRPAFT